MKYRKLPVEIEAIEWDGSLESLSKIEALGQRVITASNSGFLEIETLEGKMRANLGDYIIRGVSGETYPCKPDIFAKTYEPITEVL